ncbi:hypothetical protein PENTCL1PPCAC_27820 [Pristionchus entomophagus]|uniref:TFIIS N-terminal domain-containing protein n=1 Tax=Pristionchus entomophagus TaxID=358040 RepID=A0AAV5UGR4_9BILA|nr:hypothetical protein PENTCL1PPCAC_27820 [Pristionchus entomophagus]
MSSESEYLVGKIEKYMTQLKEGRKIGHALHRLEQIDMTVDLLTRTGVGKVVNRVSREDEEYGELALSIVSRWKQTATDHQERKERSISPVERQIKKEVKEESSPDDYPGESSRPTNNNDRKRKVKEEETSNGYPEEERREKKKSKPAPPSHGFLAALASGDSVKSDKPKKLKPFTLTLDIDPNYRPMPAMSIAPKHAVKPDEEKPFDEAQMFRPRSGLTKIFAGRKKATTLTEVPRLFDCCIMVLQNHINDIDSFGDIPYHIVKPILEKCTWNQLMEIERKNPYLEEDSDELWEKLVSKHHPTKPSSKHESWKEMFVRCENESSDRLRMLSERISKHGTAAHDKIRKVVPITDVKMTKGSRRGAVVDMPSALKLSKARKEIFESGSKAKLADLPTTIQNRSSSLGSSSSRSSKVKEVVKAGPKVGALMAKTKKMLGIKRK